MVGKSKTKAGTGFAPLDLKKRPLTPRKPNPKESERVKVAVGNYPIQVSGTKMNAIDDDIDTIPATQDDQLPVRRQPLFKEIGKEGTGLEISKESETQVVEDGAFTFPIPDPPPKRQKTSTGKSVNCNKPVMQPPNAVKVQTAVSSYYQSTLSSKISNDYETQSSPRLVQIGDFKVSELALLLWNFHNPNDLIGASKTLIDYMHHGGTIFSWDLLHHLVARVSHGCKFQRYAAVLCMVQTIKQCQLEDLEALTKFGNEDEPISELIRTAAKYFQLKKAVCEEGVELECVETRTNENLTVKMTRLMESAVDYSAYNCGNCKAIELAVFSLKCKNLLYATALSDEIVNPVDVFLEKLCDFATRPAFEIQCELDQYTSKSVYVHFEILRLWTGKAQVPKVIRTDLPLQIIQNMVYLLYHDGRVDKDFLISNHTQYTKLCGLLQISEPWSLLDVAVAGKQKDFSRCDIISLIKLPMTMPDLMNYLLSNPEAWIQKEPFLKEVSLEKMTFLVKSDDLELKEIDVLHLCHRWAKLSKVDGKSDKELFDAVKMMVRYPCIENEDFWNIFKTETDALLDSLKDWEFVSVFAGGGMGGNNFNKQPRSCKK